MSLQPTTIENKCFIIKATVLLQCFGTVHPECWHCAALQLQQCFGFVSPLFFPHLFNPFVYSTDTVAKMFFFFLLNIDVSCHLYCYTDTTIFTIFLQLLTCQFLTSRNKIIKYETIYSQPQLKINVLKKCYNTYCYNNIFTIVEISVSYISNKKMLNSQHFNINFTINHK